MGSRSKQIRYQDEKECTETRRRSSRIIALEEKKQHEIEREIALASEKKNNSVNHEIRNKGKSKATKEVCNDLSDFNEDEEGSISQGCKNKEIYQLISSIKELGRYSDNGSTLGTNAVESSLDDIRLKKIFEFIIDFLQRKDQDKLFAEPIKPNVVENYFQIVKQPMDFGTVRAKLHQDLYSNMEQFKRDIFLICSNAMSVHPATSNFYQVGKDISKHAKFTFEALSANLGDFQFEFDLNKRRLERKLQNGNQSSSRRVAPKPTGRKNVSTHGVVATKERRGMYLPPNKPLVSEILNANNPNIKLNKNPEEYKESLLRFVEDLGPTAQRVAAKKLEPLENMSFLRHVQEDANKKQWNTSSSTPNMSAIGSSSNVFSCVYPTTVISGPSTMLSGNRNSHSGLSLMPQPWSGNNMPRINFPKLSLAPNSRSENSMLFNMSSNNFPELSLVHEPRQRGSMYNMTRDNLIELPLMHQPRQEPKSSSSLEEAPPQLLQDNDEQPNLDLRL